MGSFKPGNPASVQDLFEQIAPRYDQLNDLLSFGLHRLWKRQAMAWLQPRPGQQLLDLVEAELDVAPVTSSGNRQAAVQQGIEAYDKAVKLPLWLAQLIGLVVERFGPKGLEYGRFSIDSHFTRNALWLRRNHPEKLEAHIPAFAQKIISRYRLPKT